MTALLLDHPAESPTAFDDDELVHIFCCSPAMALCGVVLRDEVDEPDDDAGTCGECLYLERIDAFCPVLGCRVLRWIRRTLGRSS